MDQVYSYQMQTLLNGPWFIMFFAPWCPHCKKFVPVWEQYAFDNYKELNFGRVDCTDPENADLCESFDVEGYPSLLLLINNKTYDFKGSRRREELERFINQESYKIQTPREIPEIRRMNWTERVVKHGKKFLVEISSAIEDIFDYLGLGGIPHQLQYTMAGLIFSSPMILICYLIMCMTDDEEEEEEPKETKETKETKKKK
mmetsp:Transcript_36191/g.35139  ORF Transcript_36191/g.35139 Transcript_36191/m.35139 type:complete len:201 (+) Transcript_36191:160-762(+)